MMWREWCMKLKVIRLLTKEKKRHAVRQSFNCWKGWILYLSGWTSCSFINFAYSSAKEEHWHKFGHFEWKMIYKLTYSCFVREALSQVTSVSCPHSWVWTPPVCILPLGVDKPFSFTSLHAQRIKNMMN